MGPITNHFSTPDFLLKSHRPFWRKTVDLIISVFREIRYLFSFLYHRLTITPHPCGQKMQWKEGSQGLVALFHGLRTHPAAWSAQLSLLKNHNKVDVFAPLVPQKGMCSLNDAATPILPTLLDYAEKNPGKPICLIGASNGGRIAAELEIRMREKSPQTPIKISTIAGVHFGSQRMNLLEKIGLAKWFYPLALRQELQYGSDTAKSLVNRLKAPLPTGCAPRSHEFYATTEDLSIPDLDSCLPPIPGAKFHILHGHSHDSIVTEVAQHQINSCTKWIGSFDKT